MTTREALERWLSARTPPPPDALARRLARAVRELPERELADAAHVADALDRIGALLLADVTARASQAPELALDLLAADAFVTYAVEAAAEEGRSAEPIAARVLGLAVGE